LFVIAGVKPTPIRKKEVPLCAIYSDATATGRTAHLHQLHQEEVRMEARMEAHKARMEVLMYVTLKVNNYFINNFAANC
jgi:hypothetical protein